MSIRAFRVSLAAIAGACVLVIAGAAIAQDDGLSKVNQARNCQTVRTCNFSRHGEVRGCLSSYTCRTCRTVRARCNIAGNRYCQQLVCGWGG
jgi:hypothetical protein